MQEEDKKEMQMHLESKEKVEREISKTIVGLKKVIKSLFICFFTHSERDLIPHILITSWVGEGKTVLSKTFARATKADYKRIQFHAQMSLQKEFNLTILFITHDLAVVDQICDKVATMYLGKIVESAPRDEFFRNPRHPYTELLLSCVPIPDPLKAKDEKRREQRREAKEILISAAEMPTGCRFHPRCPLAGLECQESEPRLINLGEEHFVACHKVA